jgi:hypothetical protein
MGARPTRDVLSGRPLTAELDRTQPLLSEASQLLMLELCEFLESAPPWRVRHGSVECPMRELQRARLSAGLSWPVPEEEALPALAALAAQSSSLNTLMGLDHQADRGGGGGGRGAGAARLGWISVRLTTNVLQTASTLELLEEANWLEGVSLAHNAAAEAVGSSLRGWQTSSAWIWMEALDEAVGGTTGCLISGALLTAATLIVTCFIGYLSQRGFELGVIEAIATTIFIGLACDYCVHVLQVHRGGGGDLSYTLAHAGPSLVGAALTTAGSAAPLLFCRVVPFRTLGEFILACTVLSLAVALTLIAPLVHICSGNGCSSSGGGGGGGGGSGFDRTVQRGQTPTVSTPSSSSSASSTVDRSSRAHSKACCMQAWAEVSTGKARPAKEMLELASATSAAVCSYTCRASAASNRRSSFDGADHGV